MLCHTLLRHTVIPKLKKGEGANNSRLKLSIFFTLVALGFSQNSS